MLVLVRARGDVTALLVASLHEEGVAVAGVDRLRLTAPLAVQDMLALIRFALQPGDDLTLETLLVSPLIGLSQDQLLTLADDSQGGLWRRLLDRKGGGEGKRVSVRVERGGRSIAKKN